MEERARNKQRWIDVRAFEWIFRQFRSLGPYLAIELILPGGSIVALLLWTYRHRSAARQTVTRIEKTLPARRELSLDPDLSYCSRSN